MVSCNREDWLSLSLEALPFVLTATDWSDCSGAVSETFGIELLTTGVAEQENASV